MELDVHSRLDADLFIFYCFSFSRELHLYDDVP
jgi:hypothetical protein